MESVGILFNLLTSTLPQLKGKDYNRATMELYNSQCPTLNLHDIDVPFPCPLPLAGKEFKLHDTDLPFPCPSPRQTLGRAALQRTGSRIAPWGRRGASHHGNQATMTTRSHASHVITHLSREVSVSSFQWTIQSLMIKMSPNRHSRPAIFGMQEEGLDHSTEKSAQITVSFPGSIP